MRNNIRMHVYNANIQVTDHTSCGQDVDFISSDERDFDKPCVWKKMHYNLRRSISTCIRMVEEGRVFTRGRIHHTDRLLRSKILSEIVPEETVDIGGHALTSRRDVSPCT